MQSSPHFTFLVSVQLNGTYLRQKDVVKIQRWYGSAGLQSQHLGLGREGC